MTHHDIQSLKVSAIPTKTAKDTKWCYGVWEQWSTERNNGSGERVPEISSMSVPSLLSRRARVPTVRRLRVVKPQSH